MSAYLPRSKGQWAAQSKQNGVESGTIHDGLFRASASKIQLQQFLLLRVLWNTKLGSDALYSKDALKYLGTDQVDYHRLAKDFLRGFKYWSMYLGSITPQAHGDLTKNVVFPDLGTFSLVRYHQLASQAADFQSSSSLPKLDFTPAQDKRQLRPRPETPTPSRGGMDGMTNAFDDLDIGSPSSELSAQSLESLPSPVADSPFTGDPGSVFKAIEDEQIVNTALILYLDALTMHCPHVNGDWSLQRHAFTFYNAKRAKMYEARVDGVLRRRLDREVMAIIEVKSALRSDNLNDILMQEGAQMAAWISQHPPTDLDQFRKSGGSTK